jgi:predicted GNAT superfamily acetyltransferase
MLAPISDGDTDLVPALNNLNATELSPLDHESLALLIEQSCYARRIGRLDAFLIAFDQGPHYESPNYLWFRDRYERFVYVDRRVVSIEARGQGLARRLYSDLFEFAARLGYLSIVCEVNLIPYNLASDAFHAAHGFKEVGRSEIHGGAKTVRYLARAVPGSALESKK